MADAGLVQQLRTELADIRILGSAHWYELASGPGDETYAGALGFAIVRSPARIELQLSVAAMVQIDAWLARHQDRHTWVDVAMDPHLRSIETERPSALVVDLASRLVAVWLDLATGGALVLEKAAPVWRRIEEPRAPGASTETWHGRSFAFDAHLAQLMSEPLGVIELCAPASVLHALEA